MDIENYSNNQNGSPITDSTPESASEPISESISSSNLRYSLNSRSSAGLVTIDSDSNLPSRETSAIQKLSLGNGNLEEFSDDSDEELQDWSLLNNISKKGMKDLEPLLTDNDKYTLSAYDQNKLNKARNLRFQALESKRGAIVNLDNLKASTIFVNKDNYNDIFMLQPKGKFLETMGFIDNQNICHFGFEEALYLVERGSCMLKFWDNENDSKNEIFEKMPPLSLQSAYSIFIKNEEQLNQYMVYSILKRDGYIINRNDEFNGIISKRKRQLFDEDTLFKNVEMSRWTKFLSSISSIFNISFPYKLAFSYFNIFTYMRSTLKPQSLPKLKNVNNESTLNNESCKEFKISFNIWKPSPNFKKKNPPLPDYQITIFKANQKLPNYFELQSLLERSNSNPDTYKPKPKVRKNKPNKVPDNKAKKLDSSWDYAKGINMENLKYNQNRITLAIVDNITINFITLSHCSFVQEGPVWRDHWVTWKPPVKKKSTRNNFKRNEKFKDKKSNEDIIGKENPSKDINNGDISENKILTPVPTNKKIESNLLISNILNGEEGNLITFTKSSENKPPNSAHF